MSFLSQPIQNIFIKSRTLSNENVTIKLQVVVSESTTDTLTVTKQPVQQGASITDHAYKEPTAFSHSIYFANNSFTGGQSLKDIYEQLQQLQSDAIPFAIITPKRTYSSMLMTALTMTTDKLTENVLAIHASYQQVIIVTVSTVLVDPAKLKDKKTSAPIQKKGNISIIASKAQQANPAIQLFQK